ncbi:reverse transcriptase domain-containing protein [Tanacetum coccineum]
MRTRSQSRRRRQQQTLPVVENLEPIVAMADNRTMAQMLQAPIEGYEDAIVVPPINANNFELKQPLINLVQSNKFTCRQDPHNHLRFFNKVTSTFRHPEVPNTSIKLLLFPFSLDGEARDWLDKEPLRSILTWDDLVSKFINQIFPPSKTTYYRNEIITFYQKPNEAWEHFKGLLRQYALDSAAGGNFLDKMPQESLAIIESKSKVRYSRSRASDSRVSTDAPLSNSSPSNNSFDMQQIAASLEDKMTIKMNKMLNEMKALVVTTPAPVKAVEEVCVTCGSNHNFNHCPLTRGGNDFPVLHDNIQQFQTAAIGNFLQRSQPSNLASQMKPPGFNQPNNQTNQNRYQGTNSNFNQNRQGQIFQPPTNQPPVYQVPPYQAPTPQIKGVSKMDFENYVKANDAVLKNVQNQGQNLQNQMANVTSLSGKTLEEPSIPLVPTPDISIPQKEPEQNPETSTEKVQNPNLENTTHVPPPKEEESIFMMKVREHKKPSAQYSRFLKMFKQLRLEIGLKDALVEMPKFNKWLSSLLRNKQKLEEIAIVTVNAECFAIIMNKVPEKLKDPGKFLILCALQDLNRTSALADSGASINLLPHSIHKKLGLEALTPTRMTLELANHSISHPIRIAEDVVVRVDGFTILADFVDELVYYADKSEKNKDKNCVHAISIIDFLKDYPFSGSTTISSDAPFPSSSSVKISDNFEKFADELAPLDSLPSGNDDLTLKKDLHEVNFQVYSNPLFEFDDNFKSSNMNPLFEENNKDAEIKSSSFTLNSPEISELEAYLEKDSIPPGIDLTHPSTLEVSSSNPISLTLTGKKDFKKNLPISFNSITTNSIQSPLLDSDSPFTAELSASITLNSLGNKEQSMQTRIEPAISEDSRVRCCMDKSKITRKQSKTSKHGHENQKSTKEAKYSKPKPEKSSLSQPKNATLAILDCAQFDPTSHNIDQMIEGNGRQRLNEREMSSRG